MEWRRNKCVHNFEGPFTGYRKVFSLEKSKKNYRDSNLSGIKLCHFMKKMNRNH